MKIIVTKRYDDYCGDGINIRLITNDSEKEIDFIKGEPEDMCLSRDLSDVYSIPDLLVAAYNAGKNGETFEIENIND